MAKRKKGRIEQDDSEYLRSTHPPSAAITAPSFYVPPGTAPLAEQEFYVFTKEAYEAAVEYVAGCMHHGGFIMRRELGDPIPLKLVGMMDGPIFKMQQPIDWSTLNK